MIVLGDILVCDDIQQTISRLLDHVGSPSFPDGSSDHRSFKSHDRLHHSTGTCSSKPWSHTSKSSSTGSHTGTHISIPVQVLSPVVKPYNSTTIQAVSTSPLPETIEDHASQAPLTGPLPAGNPTSDASTMPIAHPAVCSV